MDRCSNLLDGRATMRGTPDWELFGPSWLPTVTSRRNIRNRTMARAEMCCLSYISVKSAVACSAHAAGLSACRPTTWRFLKFRLRSPRDGGRKTRRPWQEVGPVLVLVSIVVPRFPVPIQGVGNDVKAGLGSRRWRLSWWVRKGDSAGKSLLAVTTQGSQQGVGMDPAVWRFLPQELLERVLLFLSVKDLWRFNSVSKQWRSLVQSSHFARSWSRARGEEGDARLRHSSMLIRTNIGPSGITLKLVAWELGPRFRAAQPERTFFSISKMPGFNGLSLVCVSGGFICYAFNLQRPIPIVDPSDPPPEDDCGGWQSGIFICNPLTRAKWELPPLTAARPDAGCWLMYPRELDMVVDTRRHNAGGYRVVVIGTSNEVTTDTSRALTAVYDSVSNSWSLSNHWPIMIMPNSRNKDVSTARIQYYSDEGIIYSYREIEGADNGTPSPYSCFDSIMLAYHMKAKRWTRVVAPNSRDDRIFPVQTHYSSRMLVVTHEAPVMDDRNTSRTVMLPPVPDLPKRHRVSIYGPSHIQIWELSQERERHQTWKLHLIVRIESKSEIWGGSWCPWKFVDYCYMPEDDVVWIFTIQNPRFSWFTQGLHLVLVCNLSCGSVRWMQLKLGSEGLASPHRNLSLFEPRFDSHGGCGEVSNCPWWD